MAKAKPRLKKGLIKKGTPHPTSPSFKFDSSHLTEKEAEKVEGKLVGQPSVVDITRVIIPRQHAVYVKRVPRITPKRPKLRR